MNTEPTPAARGAELREQIARVIDEHAFRMWQGMYDYGLAHGEAEDEARACADHFHKKAVAEAFAKADAVLALLPTTPPAEPSPDVLGEIADLQALLPTVERTHKRLITRRQIRYGAATKIGEVEQLVPLDLLQDAIDVAASMHLAIQYLNALAVQQADGGGRGE